jgi:hypothetical protein
LPQVTVRLDEIEPVAVDRDTPTEVVVNGTVNITVPGFVEVSVALNVSVLRTFWAAVIAPVRDDITGSGDIHFTATVTVPPRAGSEDDATLEVVANVSAFGVGRDFVGTTAVPVVQFFAVEVDPVVPGSNPVVFDAQLGAETPFSFRLKNAGNGHDSYEVRISNLAELQGLGITADLSSPITNVGPGVVLAVSGSVSLPATLAVGDYTLAFEALSTGAVAEGEEAKASDQKTIHAVESDPGDPDPDPEDPDPGDNGTDGGGGEGGLLPGPGGAGVFVAVAIAALALGAWRRARRP